MEAKKSPFPSLIETTTKTNDQSKREREKEREREREKKQTDRQTDRQRQRAYADGNVGRSESPEAKEIKIVEG